MESLIDKLKYLGCFKEGDFVLKSDKLSNYYLDLRNLISYPTIMKELCNVLYKNIVTDIDSNTIICGLPYAGIPYATTLSVLYSIPMILLRKEKKTYGTSKLIEGVWNETDEIIIIDDILTTGESIIESLPHFNKFKIKKIIVIVDRKEGGSNKLRNMGYNVESLYTIDDFFIKDERTP